jgi:sulfate adenylyltransferase subunit 1 (EFTu-like GTPase family)
LTAVFDAEIFWLASKPLVAGAELALRTVSVRVQAIRHRVDAATLEPRLAVRIEANESRA